MSKKIALFAFNGDPMCFIHVLLNTLDLHERGNEVRLVIEGSATKLIEPMSEPDSPLYKLYSEVKSKQLVHCVCRACANKMGTTDSAVEQELPICGDMAGHPSMGSYMDEGFEILIF